MSGEIGVSRGSKTGPQVWSEDEYFAALRRLKSKGWPPWGGISSTALCIHEYAQDYTISALETLATLDSNTAVETMAYTDAIALRRKIYAQRRGDTSMATTIA